MKFERGDTVRCTDSCDCLGSSHEIGVGEICTIRVTDYDAALYDICVEDAVRNRWWVNSRYFERTEFKVGDIVTAKNTFVQNDRVIYSDVKYRVVKVCNYDIAIIIDSIESTWWVPANKMRLVNDAKVNKDKAKGDTSMSTKIKKVIFNDPATIVFWEDGVKTVVKCQKGDKFDPEKGLALAISKRVLGNNYIWHGRFMKWLPKQKKGEKK